MGRYKFDFGDRVKITIPGFSWNPEEDGTISGEDGTISGIVTNVDYIDPNLRYLVRCEDLSMGSNWFRPRDLTHWYPIIEEDPW